MASTNRLRALAALTSLAFFAACGGGGSDSNPTPTTFTISGTVTGASGVTLTLSGAASATTTTDASGAYSFTGLANGTYTVTPSKFEYAFNPLNLSVTLAGADATGRDFTATAAAVVYSISGAVSGDVGAGVTLTLSGAASGTATTDVGGSYSFDGLLNGAYTVTPSKAGYTFSPTSRDVTVSGANQTGQGFTSTALTYTISGHVAGAPNVTVNLTGDATDSVQTDGSGDFSFTARPGSYVLTPSRTGFTFAPSNRQVTVVDAGVFAQDFTAIVSATYSLSGTVSGPWVEGITVTLGGAASQTTTTSSAGTYSFSGLANDDYTVTPSLDGYVYTPASATVSMNGANQTRDFAAASEMTSYSISGTVTYGGSKSGRVYVRAWSSTCGGCSAVGGRSLVLPGAGTFTIRGLPPDTYTLSAELDALGYGAQNANNPSGGTAPFAVAADVNGKVIALADPSPPTAGIPTGLAAQPGNGSVLLLWDTMGSPEAATDYQLSWGTDTGATNGTGSPITVAARDDAHYFRSGLTDGTGYYYRIRSRVGTTASAWSAIVGPIISGAVTGAGHSVSGQVSFAGTATGPLYVGVFSETTGTFRLQRYAAPVTSPAAFTVTGVPDGLYFLFAIVDQNDNGTIDDGDISNTGGAVSNYVTVAGANLTGRNFAVPSANVVAVTATDHTSPANGPEFYQTWSELRSGAKRLVGATLYSGKGVRVPADLAKEWTFRTWSGGTSTTRPTVGDAFKFTVRYYDNSTEGVSSSVTAVLDSFAQGLGEDASTGGCTAIVPCFVWTAPASPPASYGYRVTLWGPDSNWWYPDSGVPLSSGTTSVPYDADGLASSPTLTSGNTYTWSVIVEDANYNRATKQKTYTVP